VAAMQLDLQERQRQSLERLREAYDAPLDLPDEERRRWVQERSQEILDEHRELINEQMELQRRAQDGLVEEALALGRLGRTLFHQLADVLPEEAMEAVRKRYLYRAYGDLPRNRGPAARLFDQALELEDLTDEQRSLLLERRAAFRVEIDAVTERMLDTINEFHGVSDPFLRPDPDDPRRRAYDAKRKQLENDRRTINEATAEAIAATLGARHAPAFAQWTTLYAEQPGTMTGITIMFAPGGGPAGRAEHATVQTLQVPVRTSAITLVSGREHLPDPISTRDVERWVALLSLDETQAVLVDALHDDYRVRIDETVDPDLRDLAETISTMWGAEAESDELRV
ncbi:MAG: hypothetical protein GY715_01885, partial [Planctomycetes bacterium]|nr:hypothetical protein [Planctomycetota bacterium]